jgi:hypothetical protein
VEANGSAAPVRSGLALSDRGSFSLSCSPSPRFPEALKLSSNHAMALGNCLPDVGPTPPSTPYPPTFL